MASTILDGIDENRSVWMAGKPPADKHPPLKGKHHADVAIIGGGFTGVSCAWHLAQRFPGRRIVLCEARAIANGASGRSAGLMLNWVHGVEPTDDEHAARIYRFTNEGIETIASLIAAAGQPVRHRRDGCFEVYTDTRRAEHAHAHVESMQRAGLPLRYLTTDELSGQLRLEGAVGAVFDPTAGQLDGVDFLRALAADLVPRGVSIHEDSPVLRVEEGQRVRLVLPEGELSAGAVVLATNAYTPRLGYFKNELVPLHAHLLATAPQSQERWRELGWAASAGFSDDLNRVAFGSLTPQGELVFGGGSNHAYSYRFGSRTDFPVAPARSLQAVERRLHQYLPGLAGVPIAHRWSGPVALTMSRCFAVGVRGEHRNVYYAFGYSGHGVVLANMAGRILADMMAGDDERWRAFPFFQPRLRGIPPEPLRWLGYQLYTRLTGRTPRRAS